MTTNKRHVRIEDITDDDVDFAAGLDEEAGLPDPPEASEHQDDAQHEQRGYR